MELNEFKRPPNDNGCGVHWSLSVYEWGKTNWDFWAEQLKAMKIKWVKIMDDGGGSGLRLARRLVDMEIMPVVRFYWPHQNPGRIGSRGGDAVKKYREAGVYYFEVNNEPDLSLEWEGGVRPDNWLDQVVDNYIADADVILNLGGYPAVPAFGVGTNRDPFMGIVDRGRQDILDGGAWAALHNYCLGRPLAYPNDAVNLTGQPLTEEEWEAAGGIWAWEMGVDAVNAARRAGADPEASILTDSTCFRAFEQLNDTIVNAIGHSIPILTTEGGYNVGQRAGTTYGDDARYPKPTPQRCSELNLAMYRFMQGEATILGQRVPEYYFAVMSWLIAAQIMGIGAPPAENQGPWFSHKYDAEWGLNGEMPLVQMLKDEKPARPLKARANGPAPAEWDKPNYQLERTWDHRFRYMGIGFEPAEDATADYWKLVSAQWQDRDETTAPGYIWVTVEDVDGSPIEGITVAVERPGAVDLVQTKGAVDGFLANYRMYGQLGTYRVRVEPAESDMRYGTMEYSDQIVGLGMGTEDNREERTDGETSFVLKFRLVHRAPAIPRDRRDPYWRGR